MALRKASVCERVTRPLPSKRVNPGQSMVGGHCSDDPFLALQSVETISL
ncbi:MAG: hypothetical protein R3F47_06505 [Gammaproteobacteria bacterium]